MKISNNDVIYNLFLEVKFSSHEKLDLGLKIII